MARFGWFIVIFPNLIQRIGAALTVIGTGYVGYQLVLIRRRPDGANKAEIEPLASLKFYRGELERQRDFHRGLWFWSRLVIFATGPLIFIIGSAIAHPARAKSMYLNAVVFVLLGFLAVPLNLGRARKYQREIDKLDTLEKPN
jgi:hypothetical protein